MEAAEAEKAAFVGGVLPVNDTHLALAKAHLAALGARPATRKDLLNLAAFEAPKGEQSQSLAAFKAAFTAYIHQALGLLESLKPDGEEVDHDRMYFAAAHVWLFVCKARGIPVQKDGRNMYVMLQMEDIVKGHFAAGHPGLARGWVKAF